MLEEPTISNVAAVLLAASACGLFIWAAVSDVSAYRIPNSCVVLIILLFPAYSLMAPGLAPLLPHAAAGGGVLLLGIPLYVAGLAGAGDFKLLAAAALWSGPGALAALLLIMALSGGLLAGLYWLRARRRMTPAGAAPPEGEQTEAGTHLPYGVAISAGALLVLTQHLQSLLA